MPDLMAPVGRVYGAPQEDLAGYNPEPDADAAKQEMDEKLDKLSLYIRDLYYAFKGSAVRTKMLSTIADSRKAYYQDADETNFPWPKASNMISPLTTMGVDEVEPRMVAAVIGKDPYIKVKPHLGASTKDEALQITKFDNFILKHKVKVDSLVPQFVHEMLIDGTVYPILSWYQGKKKVRRIVQDPQSENGWSQQIQEVVSNGPCVELVPIEFVYHADDLDDEDWEGADVIRYVGDMTVGDIKRRAEYEEGWLLPEDVSKYEASSITERTTQQETEGVQDVEYTLHPSRRHIEFIEAFIKYPLFSEEEENLIVLLELNTFKIFRVREQIDVIDENIKPIRRLRFLKRRGISWGYPLYTVIAGIQLGVDAMWNRCINSADITMTPWGFIKRGMSGLMGNKMKIFPGSMIEIDNPDAINYPNLSGFQPAQFIPLILQYISFFERTLNVSDYMQGRESQVLGKKGSTATGTLAILQEGKVKFEYRGGLTHNEFIELFKNIHDLCVSNMPIEEHVKITGAPITKYSSTEEYIFELVGSDLTSNRFVDRQEQESFNMTMQPFMQMGMLNPMEIVKDNIISYDKEVQDYIDPELNQVVTQFLTHRKNAQEMQRIGIPEEMAKKLAEQGATAETAKTFIQQLGKEAGRGAAEDAGTQEGTEGTIQ